MNEWQAFAESTTDAALVFDRAGVVVVANAAAARLFGCNDKPLGGALRDYPRLAAVLEPIVAEAFTFGEATRIGESPFGDARTVSIVVRATTDRAFVAVRHYVSDHPGDLAFLAREHRKMDRLLKLHVEHSPLAVIGWDETLRITSWSGRAEAIFGWSAREIVGKTFSDIPFIFPDDDAHVQCVAEQLLHGLVANNMSENRNFAKDGRTLHTRWFNSVVRIGDERTMLSLVEDVTAAQHAEISAQQSRERMESLFNATPDIVLFTDAHGTITAANRAAHSILGGPALIGRHITNVVADDGVALTQSLLASVGDGATVSSTLLMRRADGHPMTTAVVSAPVGVGGRITGAFWTAHDVSGFMETAALIEASEERFRSIFEHHPDPMFAVALDGVLTRANAAAARSYHTETAAMEGRPISEFIDPRDIPIALAAFNRATRGLAGSVELLSLRARRDPFPTLLTVIPIVFRGDITGVHVHIRDMSIAKRAERDSTRQAARIRELYLSAAASNENADEQIQATIEAGCRILGLASGALFDANADRAVAAAGPEIPARLGRLVIATDGALGIEDLHGLPWIGEIDERGLSAGALIAAPIDVAGQRYGSLCFTSILPVTEAFTEVDHDLVHLMGALVGSAIERNRSRARLAQLAYHDQLTALPNRAWFSERLRTQLETAERDGTRFAVMFLDLDRFKDINDTLGHDVGDQLLRVVGERLSTAVGTHGLVARTGGDEFIVLMPDDPMPSDVAAVAEALIGAIDQPVDFDGYEQFVTTSIGISMYPGDGTDADSLVKHADIAMYRAKERGRNTFQFFTPALNATLRTRLSQEKSLRKALEREEFTVFYQPVHDLITGALVAVEALVRWQHPRLGLVMPDQFIPSAELSGLIVPLGDWITETACAQVREWQRIALPNLRVAVNLSGRQFHQQHLAAKICAAAERVGLDPRFLEIEITESVAMNDAALSVQILEQLGAAGIRLAVDDFGTGYSSLGYLRRFTLDTIKIDRSFVADVMHEPDDATIVRTVIGMAHSLGLEVVAEGVETSDQLAFLRNESCDRVQGHLFLPAVSADELTRYIVAGAATVVAPIGG